MGGCCCCCASKGEELNNNVPQFYHYPRAAEGHQPLSSHRGTVSAVSMGLLVDTNLDTSIPETYRPPPAPVPFETYMGRPQSPLGNRESIVDKNKVVQPTEKSGEETNSGRTRETTVKVVESDGDAHCNVDLTDAKEVEEDIVKSGELKKPSESILSLLEEEDVCPTCLEEYDVENPKIVTKCEHHFHLACILEWMERSDTCPVCDQEMVFSTGNDA